MLLSQFTAQLAHFPTTGKCAIAVSGGGDSLALCLMMKAAGHDVVALHFNHKLRPGADSEASWLQQTLKAQGIDCHTGQWNGEKTTTNLQQQARHARYRYFQDVCQEHGYTGVYLGHTLDDQLETFWLRLAHGSGIHGLGLPLKPKTQIEGLAIFRPMLPLRRQDLRAWLTEYGHTWLEDPSNQNEQFYRVRIRQILPNLEKWGLGAETILPLMQKCASLEATLQGDTAEKLQNILSEKDNNVHINNMLFEYPEAIQKRIIIHVCKRYGGENYPPRSHKIDRLLKGLAVGRTMPLGGLIFRPQQAIIRIEKASYQGL